MIKSVIPTIYINDGEIYFDKACSSPFSCEGELSAARFYGNQDADALCIIEFSQTDAEHDKNLYAIKRQVKDAEIPVYAGGFVKRFEDVKKYFYTGAEKVLVLPSPAMQEGALEESAKRFGFDKLLYVISAKDIKAAETVDSFVGGYYVEQSTPEVLEQLKSMSTKSVVASYDGSLAKEGISLLQEEQVCAISGRWTGEPDFDRMAFKLLGKAEGLSMNFLSNTLQWSDFKLGADGMIPVIVQDYKTNEVLMLAYMNEEAFQETILSGKMTYWSRSRNELWKKGLTSGHFQYVKSLTADCDKDTILAKVSQVEAACHTGSYSCFFHEIVKKEFENYSPSKVFDDVFRVIMDRKIHPKEGSYTNYLFDKGIDKILKKVGEEATEIVIAAKNPDSEEIKYEISDFLYHVMVLMAEKGVTWEDITRELANR